MAKKFSISEGMLNGISKNTRKVEKIQAKDNFKIEYINIDKIKRNKKNFYEIVDIDTLAEDIKLNGLNHNLVVRKLNNDVYELISGERRYNALSKLVNEGNKEFNLAPCKVIESNDLDSEIILIQANAQSRELTDVEKLIQVERLQELYKIKKKNGEKIPGKIRDFIANDLKLSPTQVGRYERINNKLIPELKEIIESGNLTIANASEFASLSEDSQKIILNIINNKVNISKQEAVNLKNKLKKFEKEKDLELKRFKEEKNERVILEKDLQSKYDKKIQDIISEVKENNLEKQRLKDELSKLKEKSNDEFEIKSIKENFTLTQNLKLMDNSFKDLKVQINKMQKENIKISKEIKIKDFLEKYQKEIIDFIKNL